MLGTGWKGKVGAIGAMAIAAAGVLQALGCMTGVVNADSLPLDKLGGCWGQLSLSAAAFMHAFSQFGIRDAIGRTPS